jgi:uncharacterized membrane protein
MTPWIWAYLAGLLVLTVLDGVWLGFVARDFYQREMAAVAAESFRKVPAVLFYLGYPVGVMALALNPLPDTLGTAMARSALVGLVAYGTYDLTNLATLKHWSVQLACMDTVWGVVISAAIGAAAYLVASRH